jgi:hypothetical protein
MFLYHVNVKPNIPPNSKIKSDLVTQCKTNSIEQGLEQYTCREPATLTTPEFPRSIRMDNLPRKDIWNSKRTLQNARSSAYTPSSVI